MSSLTRTIARALVVVLALGVLADAASARIFYIGGVHKLKDFKKSCSSVGGKFGQGGDGYSCTNSKKGTYASCDKNGKNCIGSVPD